MQAMCAAAGYRTMHSGDNHLRGVALVCSGWEGGTGLQVGVGPGLEGWAQ